LNAIRYGSPAPRAICSGVSTLRFDGHRYVVIVTSGALPSFGKIRSKLAPQLWP
jgi:hypothetical protein